MVVWIVVAVVLIVGSRDLILGHIAEIGDFPVPGPARRSCCARGSPAIARVGLGSVEPSPTALGLIGGLGLLFLGRWASSARC